MNNILLCKRAVSGGRLRAQQSEEMKVGPNTYQVSTYAFPVSGWVTGAQEMALQNANDKMYLHVTKTIQVKDIKTQHAFPANGVTTVTFKCQ